LEATVILFGAISQPGGKKTHTHTCDKYKGFYLGKNGQMLSPRYEDFVLKKRIFRQ
jgi:hypothetical protein